MAKRKRKNGVLKGRLLVVLMGVCSVAVLALVLHLCYSTLTVSMYYLLVLPN